MVGIVSFINKCINFINFYSYFNKIKKKFYILFKSYFFFLVNKFVFIFYKIIGIEDMEL